MCNGFAGPHWTFTSSREIKNFAQKRSSEPTLGKLARFLVCQNAVEPNLALRGNI